MIYRHILQTIGKTPMVEIQLKPRNRARIVAKLEGFNPSGSIKDRMAEYMVNQAEKRGELRRGMTIVEATTGNTGIALGMVAAVKEYRMIAVMPENMSRERRQTMQLLGVKVVMTKASEGPVGAIAKRDKIARDTGAWIPGQFENQDNVEAHALTTGKEIVDEVGNGVDALIAGVGTGGTLMGMAKAIRQVNPNLWVVAVEPGESAVMSGGAAGEHNIQGIGEGFVPPLMKLELVDEVISIRTKQAVAMARQLARKAGMLVGFSSGANMAAALRVARRIGEEKTVVTIFPDRAERYLSEMG